jgi:hypothetical protein
MDAPAQRSSLALVITGPQLLKKLLPQLAVAFRFPAGAFRRLCVG